MEKKIDNIKTYAICLEREVERHQSLNKNLSDLGIEAEYIGIDGENMPSDLGICYSEDDALTYMGRELSKPEIGCAASHWVIWNKVAKGKDNFVLILESDAALTREAVEMISTIRDHHSDVDLVMLSYADCVPSVWEKRKITDKYQLVRFSRRSYFASAYILSKRGAKELIRKTRSIAIPPDEMLIGERIEKDMSIYALYPRMVFLMEQAYETSTLRSDRLNKTGGVSKNQAEKPRRKGLQRLEQILRHFFISLKSPPSV
ncbi:glycosyltransferase family 25 protein [Thiohalophilus sp.]|uniref:glycosyltransferase family 25 protein n=1 Tax=Thiohalophilus sp. TaxID=3028392 RepID=UPI002ACD28F9|nr:glycosyltransferase family 25 protein [Thiohalophilus sp.]MDZ7661052.1 glycosyltransferase family 25 protein [Thiohalophilus sp.]